MQEITHLLLPRPETEGVLPSVFTRLATTLPTSTAVLIAEGKDKPRTQLWCSPAVTPQWAQAATAHARTLYAYLVDYDQVQLLALQEEEPATLRTLPATTEAVSKKEGYVVLPLAVGGIFGAIQVFGALQIQGVVPIDLVDLGG